MATRVQEGDLEPKMGALELMLSECPTSQIDFAVEDVEKLVPVSGALKQRLYASHNLATNRIIQAEPNMMIIHEAGQIDANNYIDASTNTIREIDHVAATAVGPSQEFTSGSPLEPARAALQEALGPYLRRAYLAGGGPAGAAAEGPRAVRAAAGAFLAPTALGPSAALGLVVALRAEHSAGGAGAGAGGGGGGSWQAEYFLPLPEGPPVENDAGGAAAAAAAAGRLTLTGTIAVHGYFFEDCNIQFETRKEIDAIEVEFTNIETFVKGAMDAIEDSELKLQKHLRRTVKALPEESLKKIRRVLPRTRNKMEWNVQQLRMIQTLKNSSLSS